MSEKLGAFSPVSGRPIRTLVIEDNLMFCYFVRDSLMRHYPGEFEVGEAHSLADGLNLLKSQPFDVLLLDLGLHLVQFKHRLSITLDPNEAMNRLLDRDRRAAIGVWYLKILNEPWYGEDGVDSRDVSDVLLGLHIVLSFNVPAPDPVARE